MLRDQRLIQNKIAKPRKDQPRVKTHDCLDSPNSTGSRRSRIQSLASAFAETANNRRHSMPTFVSTIKFTSQGIKAIGETTKRAAAFKAAAKKLGVKIANIFWTLGPFDGLLIFEATD